MIPNHNLLLYEGNDALKYYPVRYGIGWCFITDYLVQTGQEVLEAWVTYGYFGDQQAWFNSITCETSDNSFQLNLGYYFQPPAEFTRRGGLRYSSNGIYDSTDFLVNYYRYPIFHRPLIWEFNNTGILGVYEARSSSWKKLELLGSNVGEPVDWSPLVGRPFKIFDSSSGSDSWCEWTFRGLRIYNNSQDRVLVAEYLPIEGPDWQGGAYNLPYYMSLLNTLNGNIISSTRG